MSTGCTTSLRSDPRVRPSAARHGHGEVHRPASLVRGALDRIERVAEKVLSSRTPGRSAAALRTRLEDGLGPFDAVLPLIPKIFASDPAAGRDFRGWLVRSAGGFGDQRPCPPDPKHDRGMPADDVRFDGGAFRSGGAFFRMRLAAALVAGKPDDFRGMRDGVDVMLRGAEWVESFGGAARHFETTGDAGPFESRATLYFRSRELPGKCDLGPPEAFVDDARGCLAFLDAELERAVLATETEVVHTSRAVVWADTITRIDFDRAGCGGTLYIHGAGFGDVQPENVDLLLPASSGCGAIGVAPENWTDDRITVAAPAWLCTGCVGFIRHPAEDDADRLGRLTRRTAVERIAVALSKASRACSSVFGGPYEPVSGHQSGGASCPPCTGRNRVVEPLSVEFTVTGGLGIDSHGTVFLSWSVGCAESIAIVRSGPGPDITGIAPPSFGRFEETREVQFAVGAQVADTTYTLIARPAEACERRRTVAVHTVMSTRNVRLMELQRTVLARYASLGIEAGAKSASDLWRHGQRYIATHLNRDTGENVRFAGTGLVFANKTDVDRVQDEQGPDIDPANPSLLLFDDNERLIGCGFFGFKSDANHPRDFARAEDVGVEPDEWFLHTAGYHLYDGGFSPDPNPPTLTSPEGYTLDPTSLEPALWHPRTWDVHIFFNLDGNGAPLGPPVVGWTTARFASPPNIPRETAFGVTDPCPGGVGDDGFYESQ